MSEIPVTIRVPPLQKEVIPMFKALFVGGSQKEIDARLVPRLRDIYGIDVVDAWITMNDAHAVLPEGVSLVLIATDMCSHGLSEYTSRLVRDRTAKGEKIQICKVLAFKWAITSERLNALGYTPRGTGVTTKPVPEINRSSVVAAAALVAPTPSVPTVHTLLRRWQAESGKQTGHTAETQKTFQRFINWTEKQNLSLSTERGRHFDAVMLDEKLPYAGLRFNLTQALKWGNEKGLIPYIEPASKMPESLRVEDWCGFCVPSGNPDSRGRWAWNFRRDLGYKPKGAFKDKDKDTGWFTSVDAKKHLEDLVLRDMLVSEKKKTPTDFDPENTAQSVPVPATPTVPVVEPKKKETLVAAAPASTPAQPTTLEQSVNLIRAHMRDHGIVSVNFDAAGGIVIEQHIVTRKTFAGK